MAFAAILRRSAKNVLPLASRVKSLIESSVAVERAVFSTPFVRPTVFNSSRHFSSDVAAARSSDNKLLEVLQSEISIFEEYHGHVKTVEPPSGFPFKIKDNVGEQIITLTRENKSETITVEVSMPSLVTGDYEEESDSEDGEDDEKLRTSRPSTVPLLVTVQKKNGQFLEFDCIAYVDEIVIDNLAFKNPEVNEQIAYDGPNFIDLDENLQKAFLEYLESKGIKPSNTNFLHEYMVEKDNKEYLRWLEDVKKFVAA